MALGHRFKCMTNDRQRAYLATDETQLRRAVTWISSWVFLSLAKNPGFTFVREASFHSARHN